MVYRAAETAESLQNLIEMLLLTIAAFLPLLVPAQTTNNEPNQKSSSEHLSDECISLAKDLESTCRPIFSTAGIYFKVCPKSKECSSQDKKKALEPVCSKLDVMGECYNELTPVCYSKIVSDAVLEIFRSECSSIDNSGNIETNHSESETTKTSTKASKSTGVASNKTVSTSATANETNPPDTNAQNGGFHLQLDCILLALALFL